MLIMPFEPEHLNSFNLQARQMLVQPSLMDPGYGQSLKDGGPAFTGVIDGKIVGCAGVLEIWQGRGLAWALFTPEALKQFRDIYQAIRRFLDLSDTKRIECFVDCNFEAAHRLALKLGFTMECERMRCYTPDGGDCALYARIK